MLSVVLFVVVFFNVSGDVKKANPKAQAPHSVGPLSGCQPRSVALSSPILSMPERLKNLLSGQDDLEHQSGNRHLRDHYGFKYYFNLNSEH